MGSPRLRLLLSNQGKELAALLYFALNEDIPYPPLSQPSRDQIALFSLFPLRRTLLCGAKTALNEVSGIRRGYIPI